MDATTKVDGIRTAILNLNAGWEVDTHSWRDDMGANRTTMTCYVPNTDRRVSLEIGTGKVLVYDNGQLLVYTVAEALARYNV